MSNAFSTLHHVPIHVGTALGPQPAQSVYKVLQYTSNLYGITLPVCIAVPSCLLSLEERETPAIQLPFVLQCASYLYGSTPSIRTEVLLRKYHSRKNIAYSILKTINPVRFCVSDG